MTELNHSLPSGGANAGLPIPLLPANEGEGRGASGVVALERERTLLLERVLSAAIKQGASDVHLRVGIPPRIRVHGDCSDLPTAPLTGTQLHAVISAIVPEANRRQLDGDEGGTDLAYAMPDGSGARFRVNAFREQGGYGVVMRRLPHLLFTPAQIGLPRGFMKLADMPRGLLLVTGPTGSGKTTTLASVVNHLAKTSKIHIEMIEQPTEYRLQHAEAIVTQREVPTDVRSFGDGLRQALRQDPDVIVVGEMRDLETMRVALAAAETGHLVLATLHTTSAAKTIDRLVDQFPEGEQAQIRSQLSTGLLGVLCQQLVKRADGSGMVGAFEFMSMTSGIANKIRDRRTEGITSDIQTGKRQGMQLLDDHLFTLVKDNVIDPESALQCANEPDKLRTRFGLVS